MKRATLRASVTVGGSTYRSARGAARAWARQVAWAMERRHTDKIGMAAYHDAAWDARNGKDPRFDIPLGPLVLNTHPTKLEEKAFRRCLPIFKKALP